MFRLYSICIVFCVLRFVAAAESHGDAAPTHPDEKCVLDYTYEQRVAMSPRNKPADTDVLLLPQPSASNLYPNPVMLEAGRRISDDPTQDADALIWQMVPKTDAHAEYLKKLDALSAAKQPLGLDLVDWCEKNKLPECAEFELRRKLRTFKNYTESGYAPVYSRWLKYAERRHAAFCFPLPVAGEWMAQPSPVHRLHAESTFAMDLLMVEKGSQLRKAPTRMEDYYSWGQPILAQADGIVVLVRDEMPDNKLGEMRGADANNYIFVDYGGVIGNYAHLQQGSAQFKKGDRVKAGDVLAKVGASGAAAVPHLHYTLRDIGWFSINGKYRFEVQSGATWKRVDGGELQENMHVRNVENPFQAK